MKVQSKFKQYTVDFAVDFEFIKQLAYQENIFWVIDKVVYELYKGLFDFIDPKTMYLLEALESNKTIESALHICEVMTGFSAKRNLKLISIGGGIVQDITGFVANVLYRGIAWTFIPTTLLAACDSCIGGKTSLNYKNYKNLIGTFYPPDDIIICSVFFLTLTDRDFESGLGEVVKFNIMAGYDGINLIERNMEKLLTRNQRVVDEFVEKSLVFKKAYIEKDEFDRGVRIYLNFAHTFGHAFEVVSQYVIPHGTAVAIGMIVANRISVKKGWMNEGNARRIEGVLLKIIHVDKTSITFKNDDFIQVVKKDKKQTGENLTAILMNNDLELKKVDNLNKEQIEEAIQYLLEILL